MKRPLPPTYSLVALVATPDAHYTVPIDQYWSTSLASRLGDEWRSYRQRVRRWI